MSKTYRDVVGWFNFEPFYRKIGETFLRDGMTAIEIGVYDGKSLCYLSDCIKRRNLNVTLYGVDHWIEDVDYKRFLTNIRECEVERLINPIRQKSVEAVNRFPDQTFDFVFVDGAHDYDSVKQDIQMWLPKVKKGGIIGGDDYDIGWSGVMKAVDEVLGSSIKTMWPVWYINA